LATISLEVVFFRAYRSQRFCHFFKCILEAVFREGVQHPLQFSLDHLSCIKMASFQVYFQSEKQESREIVVLFMVKKNSLVRKEV
jgi:hypothetical protein